MKRKCSKCKTSFTKEFYSPSNWNLPKRNNITCRVCIRNKNKKYSLENRRKIGGYIYVIVNPAYNGWVKIGRTESVERRISSFNTSSPFRDFKAMFSIYCEETRDIEEGVHHKLRESGVISSHEWFMLSVTESIKIIEETINEK